MKLSSGIQVRVQPQFNIWLSRKKFLEIQMVFNFLNLLYIFFYLCDHRYQYIYKIYIQYVKSIKKCLLVIIIVGTYG